MKITKKNRNLRTNINLNSNSNIKYIILEDISDKIKIIDNEIKQINLDINKNAYYIKNKLNNNECNIIFQEIYNHFSSINIKLNDIMNILNFKINQMFKIEKKEKFNILPINKNEKNSNNKMLYKGIEKFDTNTTYQIKRIEELEILQNYRYKNYKKQERKLPIIKKPLICQNINSIFLHDINLHGKEDSIIKEEDLLLRLLLPIPEFFIEENENFVIYSLEKNLLTIQNNIILEYKPKISQ